MRVAVLLAAMLAVTPALSGCMIPADPTPQGEGEAGAREAGPVEGGFSNTSVFPGDYDTNGTGSEPLEEGPYGEVTWEMAHVESDLDSVDIAILVVRPVVPEGVEVPVVATASPYFENLDTAARVYENREDLPSPSWTTRHGFARAYVAVRGTSGSGGCMDFAGPKEQHDVDQAVTWLGTRNWSNGNVGMIGGSYEGGTQWEVAGQGNPHLETIVPVSGVVSLFDLYYRNGTIVNRGLWHSTSYMTVQALATNNPATGRSLEDTARAVCPEVLEGLRASVHASATGEEDPHGFWAERDLRPGVLANYTGSVLLVHGLQDWNVPPGHVYPFVKQVNASGVPVKHLVGQWMHMSPDQNTGVHPEDGSVSAPYVVGPRIVDWLDGNEHIRWDFREILLRWFEHWLKEDVTRDLGPPAQVEDTQGRWRDAATWPPDDAIPRTFYLAPGETLADEPPDGEASVPVAADPVSAASFSQTETAGAIDECAACATFETDAFDEPFRFAGAPKVPVTVTPAGPGGVLYGYLFQEAPDGSAQRLTWGSIDLRHADADGEAEEVEPGEPLRVRLQLEPNDAVVPEGHRLVLVVAQGTYGDHATAVDQPGSPPWPLTVEVGGEDSRLTVPAVDPPEDAFFTPPGTG